MGRARDEIDGSVEGNPIDAVLRGALLARHTCTLVATSDGYFTKQELDEHRWFVAMTERVGWRAPRIAP
jgi:hypothetical protein